MTRTVALAVALAAVVTLTFILRLPLGAVRARRLI